MSATQHHCFLSRKHPELPGNRFPPHLGFSWYRVWFYLQLCFRCVVEFATSVASFRNSGSQGQRDGSKWSRPLHYKGVSLYEWSSVMRQRGNWINWLTVLSFLLNGSCPLWTFCIFFSSFLSWGGKMVSHKYRGGGKQIKQHTDTHILLLTRRQNYLEKGKF